MAGVDGEEPTDGGSLLSWIWDGIVWRVQSLINSAVSKLKTWTNNAIKAAIAAIDWVVTNVTNYITNVYETIKEYITNVYNTVNEYITNVYNTFHESITNVYNTTNQYITNVIGASKDWVQDRLTDVRAWVDNKILMAVPSGFSSNPKLFIQTHAEDRYNLMIVEAIKAFWEGFEEGLEEEVT